MRERIKPMKREAVAAALFSALILLSLWNLRRIDKLTGEMTRLLEASEASAESGELDNALGYAEKALEVWLSAEGHTHIFIRHSEIDGTSDAFYELLSAIKDSDGDALSPAYGKLLYHIDSISGMEHVSIGSIL